MRCAGDTGRLYPADLPHPGFSNACVAPATRVVRANDVPSDDRVVLDGAQFLAHAPHCFAVEFAAALAPDAQRAAKA